VKKNFKLKNKEHENYYKKSNSIISTQYSDNKLTLKKLIVE